MPEPAVEMVCTIRDRVAELVGANRFRTWFGDTTEFSLDGERLDVTVANDFVGNWITSNYMSHLVEATRNVIGAEPRVEIRIPSPGSAPLQQSQSQQSQESGAPRDAGPPGRLASRKPGGGKPAQENERPTLRGELNSYVVGPSNELAFSTASTVIHRPGENFKHLVIHAGCGLGKTHLLQAVCNGVSRLHPTLRWRYLSGEEFTNEFVYAVKAGRVDLFRARFRNVDVLVIDDIHFLANKKATQEEFLHTFNAIDSSGKTVVLSSDRHPRSIAPLSDPLANRLIAAMVVQIDPPDFAVRREILRRRAVAMTCDLPEDVLDYVARHVTRNVRELEGALYKLVAYTSLTKEPLGLDLARRAIADYIVTGQAPAGADIERLVAAHFGITREALHSASRDRTVTHARGFAAYLIRKHTSMSFPEIGRLMGNKQHSTMLMATRRVQNLVDQDGVVAWKTPCGQREESARTLLEDLQQRLGQGPGGD